MLSLVSSGLYSPNLIPFVDSLITLPMLDIFAPNLEACFLLTIIYHSIPGAGKLASTLTRPG